MIKRLSPVLLLAAMAAACASTPNLPPKAGPEEVDVYDPEAGQYPPEGYQTIAPVTVQLPLSTPRNEVLLALRTEAARLGADAVVVQSIRSSSEGEIGTDVSRQQRLVAEGLAIYWSEQP